MHVVDLAVDLIDVLAVDLDLVAATGVPVIVVVASTAIAIATDVCPFLDTKDIFDTIKSRYGTTQNDQVLNKGEMRRTMIINGVSGLWGKGAERNVRAYKSIIYLLCRL